MNTSSNSLKLRATLVAAAVSLILVGCAAAPAKPTGAADARAKLAQLQSDPMLSTRAPAAIQDADSAVKTAEMPTKDDALLAHRIYVADRKVDIAVALAQTRYAEDQRVTLTAQRDAARLDARTREADAAKAQGATDKANAARAQSESDASQRAAADSEQKLADSKQQAAELQLQLDALHAKPTDRGLVLTLGDVLFTTGKADLKAGATANLGHLVTFLNKYPDRTAQIEGYTDSAGSDDYNQGLSERRAESVRAYLTGQGILASRLTASGKGKSAPIADNASASGRQQNRRVEVIISEPSVAAR